MACDVGVDRTPVGAQRKDFDKKGTGFFVSPVHIITAHHVIEESVKPSVESRVSQEIIVTICTRAENGAGETYLKAKVLCYSKSPRAAIGQISSSTTRVSGLRTSCSYGQEKESCGLLGFVC